MLDSKGNAKICDFGMCCKLRPDECPLILVLGGAEYQAPEMLLGVYDHCVDYWTLGIDIFCLLSGNFPFNEPVEENVGFSLQERILREDLPDINEIRKSIKPKYEKVTESGIDLVNKLLGKNPYKRLGSRHNPQKIKEHSFYKNINWNLLENGKIKPPLKPAVSLFLSIFI